MKALDCATTSSCDGNDRMAKEATREILVSSLFLGTIGCACGRMFVGESPSPREMYAAEICRIASSVSVGISALFLEAQEVSRGDRIK